MIRVVGTWENTAAAETGVKEIDQRIIVIMARKNQNLNWNFWGYRSSKNISKELIVIQQCSVKIIYVPGDAVVSKLDMVPATMEFEVY